MRLLDAVKARSPAVFCFARAALFAYLGVTALVAFYNWDRGRFDTAAYWDAAIAFRGAAPLYHEGPSPPLAKAFVYSPTFAALYAPFSYAGPLYGHALWMVAHFFVLAWLLKMLRRLGVQFDGPFIFAVLALLVPLVAEISEGQVNSLFVASIATAFYCLTRDRDWQAGAWLGLAVHIKLFSLALVLPLLLQKRWRAALGLVASALALMTLPFFAHIPNLGTLQAWHYAVTEYGSYLNNVLIPALTQQTVAGSPQFFMPNHSLLGSLQRLFGLDVALSVFPEMAFLKGPLLFVLPSAVILNLARFLGIAMLAMANYLAWQYKRSLKPLALSLIAVMLSNVTFWEHHMLVLLLITPILSSRRYAAAYLPLAFALHWPSLGLYGIPALAVLWLWSVAYWDKTMIAQK